MCASAPEDGNFGLKLRIHRKVSKRNMDARV